MSNVPPEPLWVKIVIALMIGMMPGTLLGRCGRDNENLIAKSANQTKACEALKGEVTVKRECILPDGTKLRWVSHYAK